MCAGVFAQVNVYFKKQAVLFLRYIHLVGVHLLCLYVLGWMSLLHVAVVVVVVVLCVLYVLGVGDIQ